MRTRRGLLLFVAVLSWACGSPRRDTARVAVRDTPVMALLPVDTASDPAAIVRRYFAAVQRKDYETAWNLWEDRDKDSRPTLPQFAAGFARTEKLRALVSDSIKLEGAAGSQYATVPVVIDAVLNGVEQHYAGSYTLRRTLVDGATPEQHSWRLYSAKMTKR